jgi:hypothetical protein
MGLSIHYNGYIKNMSLLPQLAEETADICHSLGWKHHAIDKLGVKGVSFAPEECEFVFLTFTPEGRLCSPINLMIQEFYDDDPKQADLLYTANVKTQHAGADAHKALINLFRYLSKKYFTGFELSDEGCYWETNDEAVLQKQFARYNAALDMLTGVLSSMEALPGETPASLAERMARLLNEKMKGQGGGEGE